MKSKSTRDALVEEDKTNVMQWHGKTKKEGKRFLVLVGEVGALQSALQRRPAPVPREVGLQDSEDGSHWREALHCLCRDTLKTWRYHLSLNALQTQRYQLRKQCFFISYYTTCSSM